MDIILFLIYVFVSGGIKMLRMVHRFSNFRKYCNVYNYSFVGFYEKIGLEYGREVPYYKVLDLLTDYNITTILFPKGFKIFEYLVIVDFPYQTAEHGETRFFHFYSLMVKEGEQWKYRPYEYLYIRKNKGYLVDNDRFTNGNHIDSCIRVTTKEALLNLIEEGKYWNGGERVIVKYDALIKLFLEQHKDLNIQEKSPCEVHLYNYNEPISIYLEQKYKENNIDKILQVSIFDTKYGIDVNKDFEEKEDFGVIFYTISNEYTKELVKCTHNFDEDFIEGWITPTTRLLSDSEIIGEIMAYSDIKSSTKEKKKENEFQELHISLLSDFIVAHGNISVEEIVDNNTGDLYTLCMFNDIHGHKTFACFTPYMGELTVEEIKAQEKGLCIYWEKEECYFIAPNNIEELKEERGDEPCYFMIEHELESLLYQLNVKHNLSSFTFDD